MAFDPRRQTGTTRPDRHRLYAPQHRRWHDQVLPHPRRDRGRQRQLVHNRLRGNRNDRPDGRRRCWAISDGATEIVLTWTAGHDGGLAITAYHLQHSTDKGRTWADVNDSTAPSMSQTHTDSALKGGATRHYRIRATNSKGRRRLVAAGFGHDRPLDSGQADVDGQRSDQGGLRILGQPGDPDRRLAHHPLRSPAMGRRQPQVGGQVDHNLDPPSSTAA